MFWVSNVNQLDMRIQPWGQPTKKHQNIKNIWKLLLKSVQQSNARRLPEGVLNCLGLEIHIYSFLVTTVCFYEQDMVVAFLVLVRFLVHFC